MPCQTYIKPCAHLRRCVRSQSDRWYFIMAMDCAGWTQRDGLFADEIIGLLNSYEFLLVARLY